MYLSRYFKKISFTSTSIKDVGDLRAEIPNPSPHQHHSQQGQWGVHQSWMALMVSCLHEGYREEDGLGSWILLEHIEDGGRYATATAKYKCGILGRKQVIIVWGVLGSHIV